MGGATWILLSSQRSAMHLAAVRGYISVVYNVQAWDQGLDQCFPTGVQTDEAFILKIFINHGPLLSLKRRTIYCY